MGDLFAVNKVRIYGGSGFAFPVDYRVQVSLDGTTLTDVAVRNGDPGMEGWREIGFDAQTARFVRVYGDKLVDKGRDGYLMQIGEVEAYGTPAVDSDAANAALEALEAARAKITGEDTTALDAAIKALKDAIADENSTQSEINALIKAADAELAKFTVSTAEAAAALAEAKNAVSDGSLRLVSEKTMNALQDAIDALEAGIAAAGDTVYQTELNTLTENVRTALAAARSEQAANEQPVIPSYPSTVKPTTPSASDSTKLPFSDVRESDWFYEDVAYVYEKGMMNGTGRAAFGPDASTTRGMIVTILARMEGVDTTKGAAWYAAGREWAMKNGISDGTNMEANITREQLATILFRYVVYKGLDLVTLEDNLSRFSDRNEISSYAVSAMNWAVGQGLVKGSGGKLNPKGNATRAQVAAILHRFCELGK